MPTSCEESDGSMSLFERLGGATGLADIVRRMYALVLEDPDLAPFFKGVSMERLQRMQFQFVASALDGPVDYTGAELTAAHAGRGIRAIHFSKFCGHFADALEEHGASPRDVNDILARLATYKDRITGDTNVDG